jgi:hypothetical protein
MRIVKPEDERFPHDLLLYPTNKPQPQHWNTVWVQDAVYGQFIKEWDGKTCPACQTPTIKQTHEQKYTGEISNSTYSSWVSYDKFMVYKCTNCRCGWTERTGSESYADTSYP